ncbi:hypothetical protein [Pantanalinema sp. GBBB05]|uniref:hypothetical protein n=1 Tax=Pantanalinema sp. GBBB05 TaxID=2604139 RepID=UPI001DB1B6BC|nr:hypothetical protein [Pantanalinema sp. GBBB05]
MTNSPIQPYSSLLSLTEGLKQIKEARALQKALVEDEAAQTRVKAEILSSITPLTRLLLPHCLFYWGWHDDQGGSLLISTAGHLLDDVVAELLIAIQLVVCVNEIVFRDGANLSRKFVWDGEVWSQQ